MVTSDLGACEWFVWDLRRSGLIDRGPLDQIVGEFLKRNPRAEAPALAEYLVEQGTLTVFQAERILNGKSQGLVLGPYVLLDAIGSGSMGQVYKASSKNDNQLYAVKVLPRRSMWNVRLARRQVRSFGNFAHPAVVPFVDVGTAGGLHYLSWPLVEGNTLEAIVQHQGKLPANQAVLYAVQVAQGLTVAQQNNLFHGLLKPSNIMIGSDNQARILDFGIGSLLVENEGESLVDTMSTANTLTSGLDCASPESIMEPTNRTPTGDQYSLGCVLYFCLTGRVPFPEGSAVEKMMAHQTKEPVPVRELSPEVPEGLATVLKRLMAKTPEGRFNGCDELVEALQPFLGDPNLVPGGVPAGLNARPSGSRPAMQALPGRSSGNMPGLPPRSNSGSRLQTPGSKVGTPAPAPGLSSRSNPGTPAPAPNVRTPQPPRSGANIPNRASFQLPAVEGTPAGSKPKLPAAPGRSTPNLPTRAATNANPAPAKGAPAKPAPAPPLDDDEPAWADEAPERRTFGTVGLVAAALLLMVAVYFGATLLMK
ncbi:MAG: protein kinase [Planctomycetia bacterium]|nr:protein kinase [Planctomycetia bacterium]